MDGLVEIDRSMRGDGGDGRQLASFFFCFVLEVEALGWLSRCGQGRRVKMKMKMHQLAACNSKKERMDSQTFSYSIVN